MRHIDLFLKKQSPLYKHYILGLLYWSENKVSGKSVKRRKKALQSLCHIYYDNGTYKHDNST